MVDRVIILLSLLAIGIILVMMNFTTPMEVGTLGVFVFFTMCYIVSFGLAMLLVRGLEKVTGGKKGRKSYFRAAVLAFVPVLILLIIAFDLSLLWSIPALIILIGLGELLVEKWF